MPRRTPPRGMKSGPPRRSMDDAMMTFTVWKFNDPNGAEQRYKAVDYAAADGLVKIVDHAIVSWPEGAEKPDTHHSHDSTRHGIGWGAFWGIVVGGLFLVPIVGGAVGAGVGALVKGTQGTRRSHHANADIAG